MIANSLVNVFLGFINAILVSQSGRACYLDEAACVSPATGGDRSTPVKPAVPL